MSEFGDAEDDTERPVAAKPPAQDVGQLEPIENLLGEDGPRDRDSRRRGGRRPRH